MAIVHNLHFSLMLFTAIGIPIVLFLISKLT